VVIPTRYHHLRWRARSYYRYHVYIILYSSFDLFCIRFIYHLCELYYFMLYRLWSRDNSPLHTFLPPRAATSPLRASKSPSLTTLVTSFFALDPVRAVQRLGSHKPTPQNLIRFRHESFNVLMLFI